MEYYIGKAPETSALSHYGILGMKWGVRRYQNKDGSLTSAGKKRYSEKNLKWDNDSDSAVTKRVKKDYKELNDEEFRRKYQTSKSVYAKRVEKYGDPYMNSPLAKYGKKQGAKQRLSEEKRQASAQFNKKIKGLADSGRDNDVDEIIKLALEYDLNVEDASARYHRYLSEHNIETNKKYNKAVERVRKRISDLSKDYILVYDVTTQTYTLRDKKS